MTIDLDGVLVIAHSDKEDAAPTWKKTYGHHPETTTDERTLPRASPQRRSEKIIGFLRSEPDRAWSAKELSRRLGDITVQSIYRQLSRLANRGLIIKTSPGAYTLPTHLTAAEIP